MAPFNLLSRPSPGLEAKRRIDLLPLINPPPSSRFCG